MKIAYSQSNMGIKNNRNNLSFGRELTKVESIENRLLVNEAEKAMGIENIALVTHSPSLPSTQKENTGIGVLALTEGTKSYFDFAYSNGINSISIEPRGVIKADYYCPYDGSAFSKKVVVDLKDLTTDEWANILPEETFNSVVDNKDFNVKIPVKNKEPEVRKFDEDRTIYDYALNAHKKALKEAYSNLKQKVENKNPQAIKLNNEFEQYKKENSYWLDKDALYEVLSDINGNDYFPNWDNELHQELFNEKSEKFSKQQRMEEIEKLSTENEEDIDFQKFNQFVVDKQTQKLIEYADKIGQLKSEAEIKDIQAALQNGEISKTKQDELIQKVQDSAKESKVKIIGDKPVGFSTMDVWANMDIFSQGEYIGAPPDMFSEDGQDWEFKFITRENLFNEDGSLAKGGELFKNLFKKTFRENPGGVRIDHILGIVDPWTYTDKVKDGSRYLFKSMLNNQLKGLQQYSINSRTIQGVEDPIKGLFDDGNPDRDKLKSNLRKTGMSEDQINYTIVKAREELIKAEPKIKTEYTKILSDIVLNAAKEVIQEKSDTQLSRIELEKQAKSMLICEDLGALTIPLKYWAIENLDLRGMRLARYSDPKDSKHIYREGNPKEQGHYWSLGTHDDSPYIQYVNNCNNHEMETQANYIANELAISNADKLKNDTSLFIRTKFARLLAADKNPKTPNNILIMWTDFLGKNVRYNIPGNLDKENNWTARIDMDSFGDKYYNKTLPQGQGINLPQALVTAMKSMDTGFKNANQNLITSLEKFANILNQ